MKERPDIIYGSTQRLKTGCGYIYVTVNNINNKPFEVFIKLGKAGGCSASYTEALGKIISVALRSGATLGDLSHKLRGVGCNVPIGDVKSCSDAIGQMLSKVDVKPSLDDIVTTPISDDLKPSCVSETRCRSCDYLECPHRVSDYFEELASGKVTEPSHE